MKNIKVAEVVTRLDWAGSPDIIRIICSRLRERGYSVKLITGRVRHPSENTKQFLQEFKDDIITVPWLVRNINPVFDCLALLNLYLIFKKERFDIVHTHTAKAGALGRIAAYLSGVRRIIHMPHGHNFYGYFNPAVSRLVVSAEKFLSRFTNRFVALSELEKEDLVKFGVSEAARITVVPSGMDLGFKNIDRKNAAEKKAQLGFTGRQKIAGLISRLEPVKGPMYFIEAARKVAGKLNDVKFIVVGEGSLHEKLESRVKELGLEDKVVFTGWRDDVLEIISFLDILVQPSLNEAIGRVLIEAQGLGVPVVATKVGGIPQIVRDGVTGILVEPEDADGLALAVCGLLEDDARRLAMSKQAREWVDEKFSADMMMEKIESLYGEAMHI